MDPTERGIPFWLRNRKLGRSAAASKLRYILENPVVHEQASDMRNSPPSKDLQRTFEAGPSYLLSLTFAALRLHVAGKLPSMAGLSALQSEGDLLPLG